MKLKFKISRKKKENLPYLFLMIGILGIFYSTSLFFIGFHNADLGINYILFEEQTGLSIQDYTSEFTKVSGRYLYIVGNEQMRVAFMLQGLSYFIIGTCLSKIKHSLSRIKHSKRIENEN